MKHIKQLAVEGLAMTAVVVAGIAVVKVALNSSVATRLAAVPLAGDVVVKAPRAVVHYAVGSTAG